MSARRIEAVVVGCSAGGLHALQRLLDRLDPAQRQPMVVVCHTASDDVGLLCELLGRHTTLPVIEARERHPVAPGTVFVAPSGYHLLIERDRHFALSIDAKVCYVRPAIDVLFETAADAYGAALLGVILTGANHDGAMGLARLRRRGGIAIVQEPADAESPEMPAAAIAQAGADHVLTLDAIPGIIKHYCR